MQDKNRRRFLVAAAGLTTTLAGCSGILESDQAEAPDVDTPEQTPTSTPESETDQNTDTTTATTKAERPGLQVEKVSDEPPDQNQKTWELQNTGDQRIIATEAVEVWSTIPDVDLTLSDENRGKRAYGVAPGAGIEFVGFASEPLEGTTYTAEDIPISPPSDVDVAVEPNEWTTPSSTQGSEIIFEFSNPTSVDLADVRETSPQTAINIEDSTLQWRVRHGDYWTSKQEVTLDTVSSSESFTVAPSVAPQYDIEITEVTENMEVSFDVIAQSEVGVWNSRAVVFRWPGQEYGALQHVTKVQQEPKGPDDEQGALVVPTIGEDRIGEVATYTLDAGSNVGFPIGEEESVGVLILIGETPVAYTSSPLRDFFG
ncbi:hypothetical protein HZS55_07875 [Halosimplex rubrum]|uniref:Uncharacterized protein n=1 Tax=Halosimplex rubrum TaxID=869889 RepID=A0A7D5TN93_9EURY|nr:hypothetical protein [Halosimplex rubrum]QLH77214.1 hypothetical protein HZS55_07875 [Halosimplex rubrum]